MSHRKDTDYLSISARIRAMENRLLTRERMDRMIDARDGQEARKILAECGYPELGALEDILAQARGEVFRDLEGAVPDPRLVSMFQMKYDYHNAKAALKGRAVEQDAARLLLPGGRYDPAKLLEDIQRNELQSYSSAFRGGVERAAAILRDSSDPQMADVELDRAWCGEMTALARELDSRFLQDYVKLTVDVANLRTAVRVYRMGGDMEMLSHVLLPGGSVMEDMVLCARGDRFDELWPNGYLAHAAALGCKASQAGEASLTVFEKACDDAITDFLSSHSRVPFGEEAVVGYLHAREQEITAIRTIFAGRSAGLDGETIRARLRETYV